MNLTNLLIWLSPLVNNITGAYSSKNTNEVDTNGASSVSYGDNDILDSFNPKIPFDLLEQEKIDPYFMKNLESRTVPIEKYFVPALFRTTDAKISDDNTPYFQIKHPLKMNITLKGFTADQILKVKASIRESIKTFDSTIGVIPSKMEHKCTLTKWDTPHGVIAGQYIPGGNDPENPNIMRCAMTAVIGTTEEYDGSVVVHEVAHAIQYYNTDGRGIRTLLSEGIAAFVERNNDNSKNLINSARSLFDNKALQNYNDDQVLENSIGRYTIGPVIIKYYQEYTPGTIRNFLECRKNEEERQCVTTHLKPYFDVSKFKKWLSNNSDPVAAKDTPFVIICNPNSSKYEISSCDSGTVKWAEEKLNNHTAMYQRVQGCFPHKQKHIPSDSDIIVYYDNYKISYNTTAGASLTTIHQSSDTTYNCGTHWGDWLLELIHRMEDDISDNKSCALIQQEIGQSIIEGMQNCPATNSVQPTTTVQPTSVEPTTTPYHVDKILLIKCDSSDSPCAVFHCNTLNGLNIVDSYIRNHCQKIPVTTDNHHGNNNIAVTIVKNDNTIQQFECINGWGDWLMQQIQDSTIKSLFANRDIPGGCRSTTSTTPSTTHTEDNNTEESTSSSIPLAIVGTGIAATTLIAAIIYALKKLRVVTIQLVIKRSPLLRQHLVTYFHIKMLNLFMQYLISQKRYM
ncbi:MULTISPECIES: hypothetical protein [unclassified Candidatus Tisiphia]|uniref:hypothetical protein n=1 Tax=unclassified Candidatus Tisiphia TaxID=2996318 RepID=UPI00312C6EEB